jgi:uncharacterized LabA/DUF88 family protein
MRQPRTALFIDGANLYRTSKALGFDIDYQRVYDFYNPHAILLRAFYFTATADQQEHDSIRPLVDWLDYNRFTMITKPMKEFFDPTTGET